MTRDISVCIVAYERPAHLREAIESCLAQTLPPSEIVIGDDSPTDGSQAIVREIAAHASVPIRYERNDPRLHLNANVNAVFARATGSHLVLLHDDDLLMPNALADLAACWDLHPGLTAAYGKQYVVSHDGTPLPRASEALNDGYNRTSAQAGLQPVPWMVGLTQQFPNDGYMITAEAAKATPWRPREEVGIGGEFEFGLRLGLRYQQFYFLDVFTAKYRLTRGGSLTRSSTDDSALQSYRATQAVRLPPEAEPVRLRRLRDFAPSAARQAIRLGQHQEAWAIYKSVHFPLFNRLTFRGWGTLLLLINSLRYSVPPD